MSTYDAKVISNCGHFESIIYHSDYEGFHDSKRLKPSESHVSEVNDTTIVFNFHDSTKADGREDDQDDEYRSFNLYMSITKPYSFH